MEIKITINKEEIISAVRAESYLSGRATLLDDGTNVEAVYHSQAGDEAVHLMKIGDNVTEAVHLFASVLYPYSDDVKIEEANSEYTLKAIVSDRYGDVSERVGGLAKGYITNYSIGMWMVTVRPASASNYITAAENMKIEVAKCFKKGNRVKNAYPYATKIMVDPSLLKNGINGLIVGIRTLVNPILVGNEGVQVKDDIECESSNPFYVKVEKEGSHFYVTKLMEDGEGYVLLYSKHDPDVCVKIG